jgi:multidrug resistance efflux pump
MITKYLLPILALAAVTYGIFSVTKANPQPVKAAPPAAPPASSFPTQVGAVGLVEAASENIAISVPVPGLVMQVGVKAGDAVRRGQMLLQLDDRDLRAELALRQSSLQLAEAKLDRLKKAPRPEDIPPAEARVQEAAALLSDAKVQLELMESVRDKRAIRREDLERRQRAVQAAEARLQETKAALALLKAGTWTPDLQVAENEVRVAREQVNRVQADLVRLTVTAPLDGQVLQSKVRAGEYAQAGPLATSLMLLGTTRRLHVRADIDEKDAWRFQPSAKALASVRGNAGRQFTLSYVRTEPYVVPKKNLTGDATERIDTRVLQVIYALPEGASVFAGQQMDVFIEGGR